MPARGSAVTMQGQEAWARGKAVFTVGGAERTEQVISALSYKCGALHHLTIIRLSITHNT
jgi:hypothetical protein